MHGLDRGVSLRHSSATSDDDDIHLYGLECVSRAVANLLQVVAHDTTPGDAVAGRGRQLDDERTAAIGSLVPAVGNGKDRKAEAARRIDLMVVRRHRATS